MWCEKIVRIIALSAVSALYCFLISLYSSNALTYSSAFSKLSTSKSGNYSAPPTFDLICHLAQAAISAPASGTTPPSSLKNPFHGLWLWANLAEQVFFSTFSQYSFYSQNLLIRFEKTDIILVSFGIASAAFGLESFLIPNRFIDGGATGISLLINEITGVPLYILLVVINLPFVFLGYIVIGRQFAIKTALAIAGLALCVAIVHFPEVTNDNLLVAVFGGFFLGAGIGLSVRGGAVIDGTEVLAIF